MSDKSELMRLIEEGEKYYIGYWPGEHVWHWLWRAVLYLLKVQASK